MTTYVLVAGAWHGAWCWERLMPLLQAAGHRVIAPDLIGMGADVARLGQANLSNWVQQICGIVTAEREPVVLVGHSRGGIVISQVAEEIPDRVRLLVFLSAFLLEAGASVGEAAGQAGGPDVQEMTEPGPPGSFRVSRSAVAAVFYNTTEPEWVQRAQSLLTPEPMASLAAQVEITPARFGRVRRAYIECTEDRAIPLATQRRMQARLPCDPVMTLATDHSPFYSAPGELASALLDPDVSGR